MIDFLFSKSEKQLLNLIDDVVEKNKTKQKYNVGKTDEINSVIIDSINKTQSGDSNYSEINNVLKQLSMPNDITVKNRMHEELSHVYIVIRILRVYISNILQKNPLSKTVLNVKMNNVDSNDDKYKKYYDKIVSDHDLIKKLTENIVPNLLKIGDVFVEILDFDKIDVDFPTVFKTQKNTQVITESMLENTLVSMVNKKEDFKYDTQNYQKYIEKNKKDVFDEISDYILEVNNNPQFQNFNTKKNDTTAKKTALKIHRKNKIIPLVNDSDDIFGYVEINIKSVTDKNKLMTPLKNFFNTLNKNQSQSVGSYGKMSTSNNFQNSTNYQRVLKDLSQLLAKKIIAANNIGIDKNKHNQKKEREQYKNKINTQLDKTVFYYLKKILVFSGSKSSINDKISVRFIPKENLVHFKLVGTGANFPFGESILEPLVYPLKLYILTQLTNIITKVSRSAQIRKWTVETGSREKTPALLQQIYKTIYNNRITASDITSSTDVSKILTNFSDLITFTKKGQSFVDVNTQQMGDPSIGTRDLEDLRTELVAISGVPNSYLGFENVAELRENLIHVNQNFALIISNIQEVINSGMNELLGKISKIDSDICITDYLDVSLTPPIVLLLQSFEANINSISNIQRVLTDMNLESNSIWLLKKFVPQIDWDTFVELDKIKKIENKVKQGDNKEESSGYGNY